MITPHKTWKLQDSSKIMTFQDCPRKYFYRYVLGWEIDEPNIHLVFGHAWHLALEHIYKNGTSNEMIKEAHEKFLVYYREYFPEVMDSSNHPKSPANALQGLVEYVEKYKRDTFDVIYTEIAGTVPVDERRSINFRIDAIAKDEEGYFVLEHKTGSRLTQVWVDQWNLKIQTGTYTHVLYCMYPVDEVYGIKINGAIFRKKDNDYIRVPIRKTEKIMDVWLWTVLHYLDMIEWNFSELERCQEKDDVLMAFPMNAESCTKYMRMCKYFDFCTVWQNPLKHIEEPPIGFEVDWWNPSEQEEKANEVVHLEESKTDLEESKTLEEA